ncbi:MAG TPA: tetratricopeptide repeat protein [Vicinamibacterales bacterium]|nr:tetratricopeptide repeat protein [Vicinamibacterales bacterium]
MGRIDLRDQYAAQALKLADRLTPLERFYIEGYYYSGRPETTGRAIDAYTKCVTIDAGHQGCRHNLGLIYFQLERFAEAAEHYQHLVRRGGTFAITYQNLSLVTLAMGDADRALEINAAYLKRNPENAAAHGSHAIILLALNRPEEALRGFAQGMLLDAGNPLSAFGRGVAQIMREDWRAATDIGSTLRKSANATARYFGAVLEYQASMFRGMGADAVLATERAASAYKVPGERSSTAHSAAATILMSQGRTDLAVKAAERGRFEAKGTPAQRYTLVILAQVLAAAGRQEESAAAVTTLAGLVDPLAPVRDARSVNLARGLAALARGDARDAIKPLEDAAATLPARGASPLFPTSHVMIWTALGRAYVEAGRMTDAVPWFEKAAASGVERVYYPEDYIRSFYYLGRIYAQRGEAAKAREAYRRFVSYWKDGDLDRDRVAEAQRKISS